MINTLYLPELREMLANKDADELSEFCKALHPARTAEFMEGLDAAESWEVLRYAEPATRVEIFNFLDRSKQVEIVESQDREAIASLISELPADDRVDLLHDVREEVVDELLPLLPHEERRDILRLRAYPEGTAGSIMTTDFAAVKENCTVREALDELSRQAEDLEIIYYLYIVDDYDHLRGLVTARQLLSALGKPDKKLGSLMETELITAQVTEDREEVANKVARYDLLAIPVVDREHRLVGIITHDDVIDVVREEATEDAHQMAAVTPLDASYLKTDLFTLSWKRGVWLMILFLGALFTTGTLKTYDEQLATWTWLVLFIPLIVSTGGNSGNQSATLVITALTAGDVRLQDWLRVALREIVCGLLLGSFLGVIGFLIALWMTPHLLGAIVVPITILLVVLAGTLIGSMLPLIFKRLGLDPALMSNPFVAGIIDILGILIYVNVAILVLSHLD